MDILLYMLSNSYLLPLQHSDRLGAIVVSIPLCHWLFFLTFNKVTVFHEIWHENNTVNNDRHLCTGMFFLPTVHADSSLRFIYINASSVELAATKICREPRSTILSSLSRI